jgi:gas vesicle protein
MAKSFLLRFFLGTLSLAIATTGFSSGRSFSVSRLEQDTLKVFSEALLQGELKSPSKTLKALSLSPEEISKAEIYMGTGYFKDLKALRLFHSNETGIEIVSASQKVNLTFLSDDEFFIRVGEKKAVFRPSFDFEKDYLAISGFLAPPASKTSKFWRTMFINEAHASWVVTAVISVAVIALAYVAYRSIRKSTKEITKTLNQNINRIGSQVTERVDEMGNRMNELTDQMNETLRTNPDAIRTVVDQSAATVNSAQTQINNRIETASESQIQLTH